MAYVYNGADQIQCIDTNADSSCAGYNYAAYGNLLSDGVTTYEYDAALRLKTVSSGGGATAPGIDLRNPGVMACAPSARMGGDQCARWS